MSRTQFGGMYRAFQFGAPPHGGMAAGVDRIVMLVCGVQNLREITLFPMNQQAQDLLMGAPSEATPQAAARTRHPHSREAEGVVAVTGFVRARWHNPLQPCSPRRPGVRRGPRRG